ncbi:MAG: anthranilate phosphoribosyltransferase [Crocinitomicaceae bacterium]
MQKLLNKIFDAELLSKEEARELLTQITEGKVNDAQIIAVMTALKMRTISTAELNGFREALLEQAVIPALYTTEAIDVCGTGGDGKNTFNISTLAAFVIAGTGYKVIKHGNYGVSSLVGSSTMLESLGYKFTTDSSLLNRQLSEQNICFLHAPLFHPALKKVAPLRKDLGMRTFFNFLGPLVNPVQPKYQLTGVYSLELIRVYKQILSNERSNFKVVHSLDGYDEISLTSAFKVANKNEELILYPEDLELKPLAEKDLFCGDKIEEAKEIFLNVLKGEATDAQMQVVLTNAAFGIQCFDSDKTFKVAYQEAENAVMSGKVAQNFNDLINNTKVVSNEFVR